MTPFILSSGSYWNCDVKIFVLLFVDNNIFASILVNIHHNFSLCYYITLFIIDIFVLRCSSTNFKLKLACLSLKLILESTWLRIRCFVDLGHHLKDN